MAMIQVLSPHVADLIAAGEVVERPASVIKELLENAFDAGADTVTVEIRGGGRQSIRVTDNGKGMAPEDAGVCFLRHATSKIRDEHDLEAIGTMGFRGEALAAISSVSRITLTTRARGSAEGVRVEVVAGEIEDMVPCGCPVGTAIVVNDLFYNTPARQKFLSSDRAEGSACVQTALRSALGRPDIRVRCVKDGEEVFFSPGDGKAESTVYALMGRDWAEGLLPVASEADGVAVTGFVTAPAYCRGNRSGQIFFCNARPIRSKTMQAALEQAYKHSAMVGKFPGCVLYITLAEGSVDVNVHPTKAEVRFSKEKAVFDAVYYGTLSALTGEGRKPEEEPTAPEVVGGAPKVPGIPEAPAAPERTAAGPERAASAATAAEEKPAPAVTVTDYSSLPVRQGRDSYSAPPLRWEERDRKPAGSAGGVDHEAFFPRVKGGSSRPAATERPASSWANPLPTPEERFAAPDTTRDEVAREEFTPVQQTLDPEFDREPYRLVGEVLGVYIVVEQAGQMLLIDKHAAHERLLFDKIRLWEEPLMPQELLQSITVNVGAEGVQLAESHAATLEKLGFETEPFGEESLIVRSVPAEIDPAQTAPLLEDLLAKLGAGLDVTLMDVRERLAETVACKAAVKSGMNNELEELRPLVEKVLSGEVKYCPHGRPVCTSFTRTELDKRFGRIV